MNGYGFRLKAGAIQDFDEAGETAEIIRRTLELISPPFPLNLAPGGSVHQQLRHGLYYVYRLETVVQASDAGSCGAACPICGALIEIALAEGWYYCPRCEESGSPEMLEHRIRKHRGSATTYEESAEWARRWMALGDMTLAFLEPTPPHLAA